jgi:transposase
MTHLIGHDRSQTLLLPESLDDYVGQENPVRFIHAFVEGLDLAAGFGRVSPKETGRPGYAPADLLKPYIYGYPNRAGPADAWRPRRRPTWLRRLSTGELRSRIA